MSSPDLNPAPDEAALPAGVEVIELQPFEDMRGDLFEVYRDDWVSQRRPVQWTVTRTRTRSVRGMHVHPRQDDYVAVLHGHVWVGLYDLRRDSRTSDSAAMVELDADDPHALTIPAGVGHAFLSLDAAVMLVGVNRSYEHGVDEMGCRWDDPELGLAWPVTGGLALSDRDRDATTLAALRATFDARGPATS